MTSHWQTGRTRVSVVTRPHTVPRGASRVVPVRPTLHRAGRGKMWRMTMMSGYMNRDRHDGEKPFKKLQRACRAIRVIASMCLMIKRYAEKEKEKQKSFLETNLTIQDQMRHEIAFDINQYKFKKGLTHLGGERLKRMLSLPADKRNVNVILALLRSNEEFLRYPHKAQTEICKCALYQRYGAKRVILREGHEPEAYYIIISGYVLINIIETNPRTGVKFVSTVNEIGAGGSFGERSFLWNTTRTSTVVCKTDVELLAIMSDDFNRVIREPLIQRQENHVDYVKSLPLFKDFPLDKIRSIPNAFSCKCFRKDRVIVSPSQEPDELVVIKEGQCHVIAEIKIPRKKRAPKSTEQLKREELFPLVTDNRKRQEQKRRCQSATALEWETGEMRDLMKANILMGITEPERILNVQVHEEDPGKKVEKWIMNKKGLSKLYAQLEEKKKQIMNGTGTPPYTEESDSATSSSSSISAGQPIPTDRFAQTAKIRLQEKTIAKAGVSRTFKRISMLAIQMEAVKQKAEQEDKQSTTHYAKVATLGPGSIFGLETIFQKFPTKLTLISEGSECIFISKSVFIRECNPEVLHVASNMVVSYPTDTYVRRQMKERRDWSKYKQTVVSDLRRSRTPCFDGRGGGLRARSAHV